MAHAQATFQTAPFDRHVESATLLRDNGCLGTGVRDQIVYSGQAPSGTKTEQLSRSSFDPVRHVPGATGPPEQFVLPALIIFV